MRYTFRVEIQLDRLGFTRKVYYMRSASAAKAMRRAYNAFEILASARYPEHDALDVELVKLERVDLGATTL